MFEMNAAFFAVAVPAVLFAGISKGGFGSGAAFASASILALVLEPAIALGIMLPLLMVVDVATLRPYWKKWSTPDAVILIVGAMPGVLIGAALYKVANADVFRLLIGGISLGFVAWQIAVKAGVVRAARRPLGLVGGLIAGGVAGFTSFVSHAGGPPAAVYLLSRRLQKTEFQATTVLIFWQSISLRLCLMHSWAFSQHRHCWQMSSWPLLPSWARGWALRRITWFRNVRFLPLPTWLWC